MKKFFLISLGVASLFAFNMIDGKSYKCETYAVTYKDGNQTRNIPVTEKTKPLIKKTLKNFFDITAIKSKNGVKVTVGKVSETLKFKGKWRNYDRYENNVSSVIFMPDKNPKSNSIALILPANNLIIFYKCK